MDLDRLEAGLKAKGKALFLAKNEVEDFDARMRRVRVTQRKLVDHRRVMKRRQEWLDIQARVHQEMADARALLAAGARGLAFDIERWKLTAEFVTYLRETRPDVELGPDETLPKNLLRELGYTTISNGFIQSFNLQPTELPPRLHFKGYGFVYGDTEMLPFVQIVARLHEEIEQADFLVGHELSSEYKFFEEQELVFPERRRFDTADWSRVLRSPEREFERYEALRLEEMAKIVHLNTPYTHVAGNDSHYTAETFLTILKLTNW